MRNWIRMMLLAAGLPATTACEPTSQQVPSGPSATTQQQSASNSSGNSSSGSRKATLPGGQVLSGTPTQISDLTWGGDFATLYGNGGAQTRTGTIYAEQGLNVKVVLGDDFEKQLEDYKGRRTHYLRGTFTQVAVHAGELCAVDPGLCPEYGWQMTYSIGDWLVGREGIDTVKDVCGKRVAIQQGGPHLGFLQEVLEDLEKTEGVQCSFEKMDIVWTKDLDGPNGPATKMAEDTSIDMAFVITPEMYVLTGGPKSVGTGAGDSIKGASVVVSTAMRTRTIADVYFVSREHAAANPDEVRTLAFAYLLSAEKLATLQKEYDASGTGAYEAVIEAARQRYPVFENLGWEDADGLYRDAVFTPHTGQIKFLNPDPGVPGIADFTARSRKVAESLGLPSDFDIKPAGIDWTHPVFKGLSTYGMQRQSAFNVESVRGDVEAMAASGTLGDTAAIRFQAHFEENATTFNASDYTEEFDRLIVLNGKYSGAPIVLSCHTDTSGIIEATFLAAQDAGVLQRTGGPGNWEYTIDGRPLDIRSVDAMVQVIQDPRFNQQIPKTRQPSNMVEQALTLSLKRCESGKEALLAYARTKGIRLDPNQVQAVGMGIRKPVYVVARGEKQREANRRIEFMLEQASLETAQFDW